MEKLFEDNHIEQPSLFINYYFWVVFFSPHNHIMGKSYALFLIFGALCGTEVCVSDLDMSFGLPAAGSQARSDTRRDRTRSPGTPESSPRCSESMELILRVSINMINVSEIFHTPAPKYSLLHHVSL